MNKKKIWQREKGKEQKTAIGNMMINKTKTKKI